MADALAGNLIRAEDHVDTLAAGILTDTTIGTQGSNFGSATAVARTALGGKDVFITLLLPVTTAFSTDASGNISPDVLAFTLDTAYRPDETTQAIWGNGIVGGEAVINTDGTILLRSGSSPSVSVALSTNVRVTARFLKA